MTTFCRYSPLCDCFAYNGPDGEIICHVKNFNRGISETHTFDSINRFYDKLVQLSIEGYKVPNYVMQDVKTRVFWEDGELTLEEMITAFEVAYDRPTNFELRDLDAFIRLRELGWAKKTDMVSCAEHDQIWLSVDLKWLASVIMMDDINYLSDCGIWIDDESETLSMFV